MRGRPKSFDQRVKLKKNSFNKRKKIKIIRSKSGKIKHHKF